MSDINWNGKKTEELKQIYDEYYKIFNCNPDWYEDFFPNVFSYELWLEICQVAVATRTEVPVVVGLDYFKK